MANIIGMEKYNLLLTPQTFSSGHLTLGGIESSNSWIYWVLWRWGPFWKGETGEWSPFLTLLLHITRFFHYDFFAPQKFLHTPLSRAPQKCFQLGPASAKAGSAIRMHASFYTEYKTTCVSCNQLIFSGGGTKWYDWLMYLATKHVFETFGGEIARLSPWLRAWLRGLLEYVHAGLWKYVCVVNVYFWLLSAKLYLLL